MKFHFYRFLLVCIIEKKNENVKKRKKTQQLTIFWHNSKIFIMLRAKGKKFSFNGTILKITIRRVLSSA